VGTHVLIDCKSTRECARAAACALPMMKKASRVVVECWRRDRFAPAETTFGTGPLPEVA
jgi:hypothetical protein